MTATWKQNFPQDQFWLQDLSPDSVGSSFLGSCSVSGSCPFSSSSPRRPGFVPLGPAFAVHSQTAVLTCLHPGSKAPHNCSDALVFVWRETAHDPALRPGVSEKSLGSNHGGKGDTSHLCGLCFLPQTMLHGWPSLTCI